MPTPVVELIPTGELDPALVQALAEDLEALGYRTARGKPLALEPHWLEPRTGLAASQEIMHALLDRSPRDRWHVAIAEVGLCGGEAGPVFGEAAHGGCCAVIGIRPLRGKSGADGDVLRNRILTSTLHELGHLAGAEHCRRASCVMYPSRDIADTDRKETSFCADCGPIVKSAGKRKS